MTHAEFREFCLLAKAVEGEVEYGATYGYFEMRGLPTETSFFDTELGEGFEGTFGAIRAFYLALFRTNELQKLVTGLCAAIKKQKVE